jgi:hypothetical protein
MPTSEGKNVSGRESIQVIVKPITTQGIGSEDEKRLGIDLSKYFTAFEVVLANETKETLSFSLSKTYLRIEAEEEHRPLNETESIQYYKEGDDPTRIIFFPKSKKKMAREIEKIKAARLKDGELAPGDRKEGLILFKKIGQDHCRDVVLTLEEITVIKTGEKKRFSFPFSCKTKK